MNKVAIIGLGLIGGSLALELKKNTWATIYGIDNNPDHLQKALDLGIIYKKETIDIVKKVDVVIIAVPVNIIPGLTNQVLDLIEEKTLVFDVGSTKDEVCKSVKNHPKRSNFVALHPIAGTEYSGPEAAIYDLFTNKVNIICEQKLSSSEMIDRVTKLFETLKMRNVFMDSLMGKLGVLFICGSVIPLMMLWPMLRKTERRCKKESLFSNINFP